MTDTTSSYDAEETNRLVHRVMLEAFESSRTWITAKQLQALLLSDPLVSVELARIARLGKLPPRAASHIRGHWNKAFTDELAGDAKLSPRWTLLWARKGKRGTYEFHLLPVADGPGGIDNTPITDEDRSESASAKISGPGPLTAAQRLAVEHRAYALARTWIVAQGWRVVEEPRPGRPYDFGCRDTAGQLRKVEVKGTCTAGGAVMITRREEQLALAEDIVLIVISNLAIDGKAHAKEKTTVFNPWVIHDGSTEIVSLRWTLPSDS